MILDNDASIIIMATNFQERGIVRYEYTSLSIMLKEIIVWA